MKKIRLNIWAFIKKHGELIAFLFLIILISSVVWSDVNDINGFGKKIWHLRFFNHFFVDGYNKFNWIGITSALAIISLTFNAWDRRRQFNADLKSKSRIKWMAEVRPIIARFVEEVSSYMYLYNCFAVGNQSNLNSKLTETMSNLKKDYFLIKLYIPSESNEKVLNKLELLYGELYYIPKYYNYGLESGKIHPLNARQPRQAYEIIVDKYISKLMNEAVEDAQEYFKDEWDRAKQGK